MKYIKRIFFILCLFFAKNYYSNTYVVTTAVDNVFPATANSLRWAIEQANANPGSDIITFNITGTLPIMITLNANLPAVTDCITLDGSTQPGTFAGGNKIIINANGSLFGLYLKFLTASGSTISNLEIKNYSNVGLSVDCVSSTTITNNVIYSTYNSLPSFPLKFANGDANIFKGNIFGTDNTLSTNSSFINNGVIIGTSNYYANNDDCNDNVFGGPLSNDENKFYNFNGSANYNALVIVSGLRNKVLKNKFINCLGKPVYYLGFCPGSMSGNHPQSCKTNPTISSITPSGLNYIVAGNAGINDVIDIYASNPFDDVLQFLGTGTANGSGVFSVTLISPGLVTGDKIALIATAPNNTSSEFIFKYVGANPDCCTSFSATATGFNSFSLIAPGIYSGSACKTTSLGMTASACAGVTYSWTFNNTYPANTASGASVAKTFSALPAYPGNVIITCAASGAGCNTSVFNISADIADCNCNSLAVGFVNGQSCFNANKPVYFTATGCTGGGIVYNWNFGDGNLGTGQSPTHNYSAPGTYTVVLMASGVGLLSPVYVNYVITVTSTACPIICPFCPTVTLTLSNPKPEYCVGEPISFDFIGALCGTMDATVDMGDCAPIPLIYDHSTSYLPLYDGASHQLIYTYNNPGTYNVFISQDIMGACPGMVSVNIVNCDVESDVSNPKCQSAFAPTPGDYLLSFWVKEENNINVLSYSSGIIVKTTLSASYSVSNQVFANQPFNAQNKIMDGWQKVEKIINIPAGALDVQIALVNNDPSQNAYFDDIRFHPVNSGFKSYVYDPVSLRLVAELDDRNYATFYEYDEEGQLIRVKKETERGIKTIKENRTSVKKK